MRACLQTAAFAWLLFSCGVSAAENGLTGSLQDPKVVEGTVPAVEVRFVLKNGSSGPVTLAERWNSSGARQWSFTVEDANKKTYELQNPQMNWFANFLTLFTLAPSGTYALPCRLIPATTNREMPEQDGVALFYLQTPLSVPVEAWVFPLKITGHFSAELHSSRDLKSNWQGAFDTPTITVKRSAPKPMGSAVK